MPFNQEFLDEHIEHFGVKGMRWGVRRKRKSSGKSSSKPKKSMRERLKIKPWDELDDGEKRKRTAKIIAGLLVADFAQTKIRQYTHVSVRAHNKRVVKNKVKKPFYDFAKKVAENRQEIARREATIKLMANAKSGVAEAIQYVDATWNN